MTPGPVHDHTGRRDAPRPRERRERPQPPDGTTCPQCGEALDGPGALRRCADAHQAVRR
ncbi:MAG: hypothetical protein FWH11_01190 [Micrococcales bacterium]|nr:hypothetical protein [Micrococcales bacterium]